RNTEVTPKTPAALHAFDQRTGRMSGGASTGMLAVRNGPTASATRALGSVDAAPNSPRYVHPSGATAISLSARRSPPSIVTAPTTRSAPKVSASTSSFAIPFWGPPTQPLLSPGAGHFGFTCAA